MPNLLSPHQSLNKAFLKVKPTRQHFEQFKRNLEQLLNSIKETESEEYNKNLLRDFLKDTYYQDDYFINTKYKKDLVIYNNKTDQSTVGVILECKQPNNQAEMPKLDKLNVKALQQLLLYFFQERVTENNINLKHLIITNVYEWFIFDAKEFEKLFYNDTALRKQFNQFTDKKLTGTSTDFFYKDIAKPAIAKKETDLNFVYVNLREGIDNEKQLRDLYKLFSPEHLLKLNFTNDSNSLDKEFYNELLYIIGLTEVKEKNKKLIKRNKAGKRNIGSLIENAITQLQGLDKLSRISDLLQFGDNTEEQLFNVSLELVITWVNRILFLKLLEAQLINYHQGDKSFAFLHLDKIKNYSDLNFLFFNILACENSQRDDYIKNNFATIPYLNSSLFEPTNLEHETIVISNLRQENLPIFSGTVLKNITGKKRTGNLNALQYLFEFLDAYDFSSEGSEAIQEDNKRLINASVLGLIFEKINGYKDGSFFTPGFITMYMCRETIRRGVIQKFNQVKKWNCNTINDLYNKIDDKTEANEIINSLKICDPAVGSGHFLVSALNEIISIKSELKILQDKQGKTLRDYTIQVVNDELVIEDDNETLFEYNPKNKESQRVQETLFHEKKTIIENCLFGVDINPNSVKICRLRLWIELLKNAYYKGKNELETLPNIDINIKCGNSLISRFTLDSDLKVALSKSKSDINTYQTAVQTYRSAKSKEEKREMERLITKIKENFKTTLSGIDPKKVKLRRLESDLYLLENQTTLLEETKTEKKAKEKKMNKLQNEIDKLTVELEDIESGKLYQNAFEWRFEFPEVLNNKGDFVGFDIIIGNPPYVFARENFNQSIKNYFSNNYNTVQYQVNLFLVFIEKSILLLGKNSYFTLIVPNSLLMVSSATNLREYLLNETLLTQITNLPGYSFEGVNVETIIIAGRKDKLQSNNKVDICTNNDQDFIFNYSKNQSTFKNNEKYEFNIFSDEQSDKIIQKITNNSDLLDDLVDIKSGLIAYESGKGNPKQTPNDVKKRIYDYRYKFDDNTYKYLEGKDVNRYFITWSGGYLQYGKNLAAPRKFNLFNGKKIIIREITSNHPQAIIATYSEDIYLFNRSNIAILEKENSEISLKYILSILNSTLMSYYFIKNTAKSVRKMFPKLILEDLRKFPVKNIGDVEQTPFIKIVDQVLDIKNNNSDADVSHLEKEIDEIVYELYGLTPEEIAIVESSVTK